MTSLPTMQALRLSTSVRWQQAGEPRQRTRVEWAARRHVVEVVTVLVLFATVLVLGTYAPAARIGAGSGSSTMQGWLPLPAPNAGAAAWTRYYRSQVPGMRSAAVVTRSATAGGQVQILPVPVPAPTPSVQPQVQPTPAP